jgi:hypothetical protein
LNKIDVLITDNGIDNETKAKTRKNWGIDVIIAGKWEVLFLYRYKIYLVVFKSLLIIAVLKVTFRYILKFVKARYLKKLLLCSRKISNGKEFSNSLSSKAKQSSHKVITKWS